MIEIKDGGQAFPNPHYEDEELQGMSLRDYFAAKALAGMCAHPDTWGLGGNEIAAKSYEIANAMLRARGAA